MYSLRPKFSARLLTAAAAEGDIPLQNTNQEFSGRGTALTPAQMRGDGRPALFKKSIPWPSGGRVFDIGAGHPKMVELLRNWFLGQNITYMPYDKFNGDTYNGGTEKELRKGKADVATASNLLNVIPDLESRLDVIRQMHNALKPGGRIYITVHRSSGKQPGQSGKDQWQNHRVPKGYLEEVQTVFPDAHVASDMIQGTKGGKAAHRGPQSSANRMVRIIQMVMQQDAAVKSAAILTSYRVGEAPKVIRQELLDLQDTLKKWGLGSRKLAGQGQQPDGSTASEPSFFVANITLPQAQQLWAKYEQWGILYGGPETNGVPLLLGAEETATGFEDDNAELGAPNQLFPEDQKPVNWSEVPGKRNAPTGHGFELPYTKPVGSLPGYPNPRKK